VREADSVPLTGSPQPVLVLGNKSDLSPHASSPELIRALDLRQISDREVSFFSISGKLVEPGRRHS